MEDLSDLLSRPTPPGFLAEKENEVVAGGDGDGAGRDGEGEGEGGGEGEGEGSRRSPGEAAASVAPEGAVRVEVEE